MHVFLIIIRYILTYMYLVDVFPNRYKTKKPLRRVVDLLWFNNFKPIYIFG
jgi:hypothetical protein